MAGVDMSIVRIFELAREYGIESAELIDRIRTIGIQANDHLSALDQDTVVKVRALFDRTPPKSVVEERVNRTVVRRRARRHTVSDVETEAAAPVAVDKPGSTAAEPEVVAETPKGTPVEAVPVVQDEEKATDAPPPKAKTDEPKIAVEAGGPPAPAKGKAPADKKEGNPTITDPTMQQAVVVKPTTSSDHVARAVAQTRAEKGYDRPESAPPPPGPDGKPSPEAERSEYPKKKKTGRRLVYDKRRDHLMRRGLLDHDDIFRGGRSKKKRPRMKKGPSTAPIAEMKEAKKVVKMDEAVTISELSQAMMVKSTEVIQTLMGLGIMATVNQTIDFDTASMVAEEMGWRVESTAFDLSTHIEENEETSDDLVTRAPIITVMGHVDHGKTSLLDCIRNTSVAAGEAGGITQHIGASTVDHADKGTVVFVDTPGHAAFTAMRARGAKVTDIVILVVAADDGVMPQTIEAINHAKEAECPIIVALNKIDKNNANPDKVIAELSEQGLVAEDWGGDTVLCKISALKNEGIDNLLDMVLLQAELMELTASPTKPAKGVVLEGRLEKGRGPVATLLVQEGTLNIGDNIVCGMMNGRVRAMTDAQGKAVTTAGPATPVEVIGLSGVPDASEEFIRVKDDRAGSKIVDHRQSVKRKAAQVHVPRVSLDSLQEMLEAGQIKELKIVIKADVHGSAEALRDALVSIEHDEVAVKVIHIAVGGISESDVHLASASNAIIIGFGVRPESKAKALAEKEHVELKLYSIIYEALDDVKLSLAGLLAPVEKEAELGHAEVREIFSAPKVGTIAGCSVTDGTVQRNCRARLVRDSVQVYDGHVGSLRRFKSDVKEVQQGYECGISLENFNDIKVGDIIEAYEIQQIAATL
jgi:translation initiation factor IF-2